MTNKVLIFGSGAREHALAVTYLQSPHVNKVIVAPGNSWMQISTEGLEIDPDCSLKDATSMVRIAEKHRPDLIDVAQDDALAAGTVDLLTKAGFRVFGPTKAAARIEWDKAWARQFMKRHGIPSPEFHVFSEKTSAMEFVEREYSQNPSKSLFIKASGLAAGKGALKATSLEEAKLAIQKMDTFGEAGKTFVIEEGLEGEEFSFYAISDGIHFLPLISAQDHKRQLDHDLGEQTGGMGVVAPTSVTEDLDKQIIEDFIAPVIKNMEKEGIPYIGILYFSGIVTSKGMYAIEYNARWGDPECQAILPSLETDYFNLVTSCLEGKLDTQSVKFDGKTRICLVGASFGYPVDYSIVKGKRLLGLDTLEEDILFFSAGLAEQEGQPVANGGRLFSLVAAGSNIVEARKKVYSAMSSLMIEGNLLHFRTDIGWRDLSRILSPQ
ncbi:MAG: phosphoribosylamine--glycine ligase [Methanobacteriota archaeon]|nr:MAG: phosphoribosylamine--glycine ligase [Euryarchaeota archaeon]